MQASISAFFPPFVKSYLRARYESKQFDRNPDAQLQSHQALFAAGLWDAVTAYFLDADHVALLCPQLKIWHLRLHTNVRARALQRSLCAIPEELVLSGGAQQGDVDSADPAACTRRVDLAQVSAAWMKNSPYSLRAHAPCGPFATSAVVAVVNQAYFGKSRAV